MRWRLIVDGTDDGAWNMAVDEAILEACEGAASSVPTLRLYGWTPAAVSLGRTQDARGSHDPEALREFGFDLVRRPSGGETVLHELERTYAVVGGLRSIAFPGGVVETYRAISHALIAGLSRLGIAAAGAPPRRPPGRAATPVCFEHAGAFEIAVSGRKLVGSAQARRRTAFLQHGSIPFRLDPDRLGFVLGRAVDGSKFIDLERASRRSIESAELDRAIVAGFEEALGARFDRSALTEAESLRAAELRCWKYDSISWTAGGRIGAREARWGPVGPRI